MRITVLFIWLMLTGPSFSYEIMEGDSSRQLNNSYHRIISLYPAHTEVILDLGGRSSLVGTVKDDKLNERTLGIRGFSYGDDLEKFLAAKPDLVLIRPMYRQKNKNLFKTLERMGITVVSLQPSRYDELERYWLDLGRITGRENSSIEYINRFRAGLKNIKIPTGKRKKVFFEARMEKGLYTASESSIASFIIEKAGGEIIVSNSTPLRSGSSVLSPVNIEYLISRGQEVEIYLFQTGRMNRRNIEAVRKTPGYRSIKAVRRGEIYFVDEASFSRPTIKILETIKRIQRILAN